MPKPDLKQVRKRLSNLAQAADAFMKTKEETMSKKQSTTKPKPAAKKPAKKPEKAPAAKQPASAAKGQEAAQKPATAPQAAKPAAPAPKAQVGPDAATVAPTAAEPAKGKGKPAPAAQGRTLAPDPRLPAPGTVIEKKDRHGAVRCECKVEEAGIRYAGKLYSSISSAALAAARDLGLKNKTQNGYIFWGLEKPPRPETDLLAGVESAWTRYCERVEQLIKDGVTDENRSEVAAALGKHLKAIEGVAKARAVEAR